MKQILVFLGLKIGEIITIIFLLFYVTILLKY